MSMLNKTLKINRVNIWHKFEHYEAVANIKKPENISRDAIAILEMLVDIGENRNVLSECDIFSMRNIILSLNGGRDDTRSSTY